MAERKAAECHGGWLARLPGERAVNRIPSPPVSLPPVSHPPLPTRAPSFIPLKMLIEEFYSGRLAPRLGFPPVSGRRTTTGSALCDGISMGLHKPEKSLGQRRVLPCYKNRRRSFSLALPFWGCDNTLPIAGSI